LFSKNIQKNYKKKTQKSFIIADSVGGISKKKTATAVRRFGRIQCV
jgi:hypothetical protein